MFIRLPTLHTICFGNISFVATWTTRKCFIRYIIDINKYTTTKTDCVIGPPSSRKSTTHTLARTIFHSLFSDVGCTLWLWVRVWVYVISKYFFEFTEHCEYNALNDPGDNFRFCEVTFSNRRNVYYYETISAPTNK